MSIYESLCWYDPRNPNCDSAESDFGGNVGDCCCDNCHTGRAKLANEVIRLTEEQLYWDRMWRPLKERAEAAEKLADRYRKALEKIMADGWCDEYGHKGLADLIRETLGGGE